MKKIMTLVLSILLGAVLPVMAQNCLPLGKDRAFQSGEQLTFSLMYKWGAVNTEVGMAELSIDSTSYNGIPAYHSALKVKSMPFFDVFFKMREHFQGWMAQDNVRPLKFIRDTHEGNYTATNLYYYDWDKKIINADIEFNKRGPKHLQIPVKECVFDIGSILYYARCMDVSKLRVGGKYPLSFAIDDDVYDVILTYRGKETIKARKLGKVRCMRFSCSVVSGQMFSGDEEFLLWISDDGNRLPVAFMAPLRVGAVRGWLKGYDNLKYDFSSLQK
ncbi:MAG: DUF3108 domain-containing protein [Bacteroidales bacterium]|nr:DUF3108 domain-containing protein [Bacteroidales bacterium]